MGVFHITTGIVLSSLILADITLAAPEGRIVGGQHAKPGQFPYQILLKYRGSFRCGGSIISKNFVLTAAHCVMVGKKTAPARDFRVVTGSVQAKAEAVSRAVSTVTPHPNYKVNQFNNDIALLKLSSPLSFNSNVNSVKIHSGPIPSGSKIIISGFGGIYSNGPLSPILKWNTATALSDGECRKQSGPNNGGRLCLAKTRGNGACFGDSGGPAVYNGRLVGVANFIIDKCGTNNPDGYAKVPFFINWIKKNSDI